MKTPTARPDPIAVDVRTACEILSLSDSRVRDLLNAGAIESRYEGRKRLVSYRSLAAYFESLPLDPPGSAA